jgi:hypothetical protein
MLGRAGQFAKPDAKVRTKASRYAARSVPSALMGPSFGTAADATGLIRDALEGDWKPSDTRSALNFLPFRTLPFIRSVLEYYAMPARKDAGGPSE